MDNFRHAMTSLSDMYRSPLIQYTCTSILSSLHGAIKYLYVGFDTNKIKQAIKRKKDVTHMYVHVILVTREMEGSNFTSCKQHRFMFCHVFVCTS
jgi:hypothetical protein